MNRSGFLRRLLLAPVAAMVGCRKPEALVIESEPVSLMGSWSANPIRATAWTISHTGNANTVMWVVGTDGKWTEVP